MWVGGDLLPCFLFGLLRCLAYCLAFELVLTFDEVAGPSASGDDLSGLDHRHAFVWDQLHAVFGVAKLLQALDGGQVGGFFAGGDVDEAGFVPGIAAESCELLLAGLAGTGEAELGFLGLRRHGLGLLLALGCGLGLGGLRGGLGLGGKGDGGRGAGHFDAPVGVFRCPLRWVIIN